MRDFDRQPLYLRNATKRVYKFAPQGLALPPPPPHDDVNPCPLRYDDDDMPVVPRTSDAGNGTEITSPNVAAKTVVGMVLGIREFLALRSPHSSLCLIDAPPSPSMPVHHNPYLPVDRLPAQEARRRTSDAA